MAKDGVKLRTLQGRVILEYQLGLSIQAYVSLERQREF